MWSPKSWRSQRIKFRISWVSAAEFTRTNLSNPTTMTNIREIRPFIGTERSVIPSFFSYVRSVMLWEFVNWFLRCRSDWHLKRPFAGFAVNSQAIDNLSIKPLTNFNVFSSFDELNIHIDELCEWGKLIPLPVDMEFVSIDLFRDSSYSQTNTRALTWRRCWWFPARISPLVPNSTESAWRLTTSSAEKDR